MPLEKVWIHFFFQLLAIVRQTGLFNLGIATSLREGKLKYKPAVWDPAHGERLGKYESKIRKPMPMSSYTKYSLQSQCNKD